MPPPGQRHESNADTRDPRALLASIDDSALEQLRGADEVAKAKAEQFAQGVQKKSRHEREQEAARKKQEEADAEAARAYADFVASFGGDDDEDSGRGNAASRDGPGGAAGRNFRTAGKGFVRAGGSEAYNPLKDRPAPNPPAAAPPSAPRAMRPTAAALLDDDEEEPNVKPSGPPGKKKRDMDNFLEQLKRDQNAREERLKLQAGRVGSSVTALAAREHAPVLTGSFDTGDPLTTNVHVAGLPPNVTEQSLGMFFAQFGPVGSVKIMWPRGDNVPFLVPGGRRMLGGFVAFLRRPDAEKAAKELDGAEWGGSMLKTSWGKAVPVPARAIYEIEGASSRSDRARDRDRDSRGYGRRSERSRSRSRSRSRERSSYSSRRRSPSRSRSRSPPRRRWPTLEDGVDDRFLRSISARIREHGRDFEDMLRDKERDNRKFDFLRDDKLPSFHYFKMLLDSRYEPPPVVSFSDEGNADLYSSDSAEESEQERTPKGRLGRMARKRFESMLRSLTSTREKIARGMVFALEHADSANIIADILVASLTIDETPVPRKMARLNLVSDILHNASASLPNAWAYRSVFESKLPAVFDHLGDIYLSFPGRMKAEQFRGQVMKVVDIWEQEWMLFEPSVIEDFRQRLSGSTGMDADVGESGTATPSDAEALATYHALLAQAKAQDPVDEAASPRSAESGTAPTPARSGFKTTFQPSALDAALPEPELEGDIDGQDIDLDGDTLDGEAVDGAPMMEDDVDGAPMVVEEDVDGEAVAVEPGTTEVVVLEDDAMDTGPGTDDDIF